MNLLGWCAIIMYSLIGLGVSAWIYAIVCEVMDWHFKDITWGGFIWCIALLPVSIIVIILYWIGFCIFKVIDFFVFLWNCMVYIFHKIRKLDFWDKKVFKNK